MIACFPELIQTIFDLMSVLSTNLFIGHKPHYRVLSIIRNIVILSDNCGRSIRKWNKVCERPLSVQDYSKAFDLLQIKLRK